MKTDAEVLVEQIMVHGVSVFRSTYYDHKINQAVTEWNATCEDVDFQDGLRGICGTGDDPASAVRDMLSKKGLPCE